MSETGSEIRLDVTGKIKREGPMDVEWTYMRGERGIKTFRTALLADGQEVAADEHEGWAGGGSHGNTYHLNLPTFSPKAKYELVGKTSSPGGTESFGEIWLFTPEE